MITVSAIIPVYNSERYLRRCIDSVLRQGLENIEIILVDDGSTDASHDICDEYARLHPHVKAIHTENGGPATAKNIGYEYAQGEYVGFFDSDDMLHDNMLQTMYALASKHNADIVCCNYEDVDEALNPCYERHFTHETLVLDKDGGLTHLLQKDRIFSQCWTKIYKKAMLDKHSVNNVQGLKTDEDFIFNLRAFTGSDCVCVIDEPLYVYTNRESSLSKDFFRKYISQFVDNMTLRLNMVDETIRRDFPHLVEHSTFHCLMYYNELIGKVAMHEELYHDPRISKIFRFVRRNWRTLLKYHVRIGMSKMGVLLITICPNSIYLSYRKSKQ